MRSDQNEIRPDPTVVLVDDLLTDIGRGRVRVPAFQRPFVWRPGQMLELFDSIERGYPIGSLLVWQTDEEVRSLDHIGGMPIPPPAAGSSISYILDGHQRVSTLFGVLRHGLSWRVDQAEQDWIWRVYRDLRHDPLVPERYRHYRPEGHPPSHLLPLAAVMRTMDFLGHFRRIELQAKDPRQVEELIREAEAVAQRIKSYKLTLVRLQGASLDQAVNVYSRLNRTGTRMDPDQMVSALTYKHARASLADRIDDIVTSIAETGFGELPRIAVFRAMLAVAGETDILSPRWDVVARDLQNRLHNAIPDTERAVGLAVRFLQTEIGVPLARLLPYSHQLVLLATFFHHRPEPTTAQVDTLRTWFWVTSWTSAFGGATSTLLRRALQDVRGYALGSGVLPISDVGVQPMPEAFNLNSARTKAYVIWELLEFPRRLDVMGQPFDVVKVLASGESQSYRQVAPGDKRPANRLVMPTRPDVRLMDALKNLDLSAGQLRADTPRDPWSDLLERAASGGRRISPPERVLTSHGIPLKAWRRLCEGNKTVFVDDRTDFLKQRLREFAAEIGVRLGDNLEGVADDDSE
ncbi:DUF262 domain-containing protein [Micromonospora sp. NPDC005205]|uniref:GmrSD restriction endonuclease domain-containing protein n=1 Tax=Micromonospora sp. NPDC005205 TaxID=3156714 RepID=UPI0033A0C916